MWQASPKQRWTSIRVEASHHRGRMNELPVAYQLREHGTLIESGIIGLDHADRIETYDIRKKNQPHH